MTIELSKETVALLEEVLASGDFDSAEHVIQHALGRTLTERNILEDEAFVKRAKAALARSKADVEAGRVQFFGESDHGELYEGIKRRAKERGVSFSYE